MALRARVGAAVATLTLTLALTLALALGPALAPGAAGAEPDPAEAGAASAASATWTVSQAQTVSNKNVILNGVHVPAAGDVWAVGYRHGSVGGAYEFRTTILHSTGGGPFQLVPSPDREGAPATNFLQDVHGSAPDDLWAVGHSRDPRQPSRTLIEHWNGTSWTIWPSADPGPSGNILEGVVALSATDAWAVGARQDSFYQTPLVERFNGSTWSAVTAPNPDFCTGHSYLTDIAARSATSLFATGICTSRTSGGDQGYVLQWNGVRWKVAAVTALLPNRTTLDSVSTFNKVVWLAGTGPSGAFTMRSSKAGSWTAGAQVGGTERTYAGIVARGAGVAWAVGTGPSPQSPFAGPGAARITETTGEGQTIPVDFGRLYGVAWDPAGRLWAVGTQLPGQYNTPLVVSAPAR